MPLRDSSVVSVARREFGSIIERGSCSWEARYSSPRSGRRVSRRFRSREEAALWLDDERLLVAADLRGLVAWTHPTERDRARNAGRVLFSEFADWYCEHHRCRSGEELRGSSKRNLLCDVAHLKDEFGSLPLADLTTERIRVWYERDHPEGPWSFKRQCERLKSMLRLASVPGRNGVPALIESNPFSFPIPEDPVPRSWSVPPVTPDLLWRLYAAMPEYTRLSVYLAACAGGLRPGELCGLFKTDFDLEGLNMSVSRGVGRGVDDLGPIGVGPTKTRSSRRTVPLPAQLVPLIDEHLAAGDADNPMFFEARRGRVLAPTTIEGQFRRAREAAGAPAYTTFRTLRSTHGTMLSLNGGTVKEAMESMGHSSEYVQVRHYQRVVPEHLRQVTERLAREMLSGDPRFPDVRASVSDERLSGRLVDVLGCLASMLASGMDVGSCAGSGPAT